MILLELTKLNQVGDLIFMSKPQTSVWGKLCKYTVASERRFMIKAFSPQNYNKKSK